GVALGVAGGVVFGVAALVENAIKHQRTQPWLLGGLCLSWLFLIFASSGGLVWLSSGRWPVPVWPY
uniref:hypothetical protein n=1 Tax=Chloroflexus sp. TaxID=1904827 RepID=UPI002ADDF877